MYQASKEKARLDVLLTSAAVAPENFENVLREKLNITRGLIYREIEAGRFPVMGYSYYEYAQNLLEDDVINAALFSSYALELSDMSLYFPRPFSVWGRVQTTFEDDYFLGFVSGAIVLLFFWVLLVRPQK